MDKKIFETENFIVESVQKPHVTRTDGGHIKIKPKVRLVDRTELSPQLAIELMRLTMVVGEAMTTALNNVGIDIGRINYQDMGNWSVFKPEGAYLHIHLYGRAKSAKIQKYGDSCHLPHRDTGFYDSFEPLQDSDILEIKNQIEEILKRKNIRMVIGVSKRGNVAMKKIIILEGIATSGKTSVLNELKKILEDRNCSYLFIDEAETLMPLIQNTDPVVANTHMVHILQKYLSLESDVLIFDRLYLTHIWRTGTHIENFGESTALLVNNNTHICFLEIPNNNIQERITHARSHRDEKWNSYVDGKGSTQEEIFTYYSNQQRDLLSVLNVLPIPHTTFDTGDMDFERIAKEIHLLYNQPF